MTAKQCNILFCFWYVLGRSGNQIIVPYRGDEMDYRSLRLMGDLGQIMFFVRFFCSFELVQLRFLNTNYFPTVFGCKAITLFGPSHSLHELQSLDIIKQFHSSQPFFKAGWKRRQKNLTKPTQPEHPWQPSEQQPLGTVTLTKTVEAKDTHTVYLPWRQGG